VVHCSVILQVVISIIITFREIKIALKDVYDYLTENVTNSLRNQQQVSDNLAQSTHQLLKTKTPAMF